MHDLRGPARWLRLGTMVGAAGLLLFVLYIGYRAWSVPDIGPPFPPDRTATARAAVAPEQDAARDYERILHEYRVNQIEEMSSERRSRLIEELRHAAEKPDTRFMPPSLVDSNADWRIDGLTRLVRKPLLVEIHERIRRGELTAAWDDLATALRIAAHISRAGPVQPLWTALELRQEIFATALPWAADPGQTPAMLRRASDRVP